MWALATLLLSSTLSSAYVIIDYDDPDYGVLWPTEYYFKGDKISLSSGVVEQFEIWYSAELNRSRVSYYNGLDSTYYYSETESQSGHVYKVYPITNYTLHEEIVCSEEYHSGDATDFLPDIEGYEYSGEMTYNNNNVSVWKNFTQDEHSTEYKTLYVHRHSHNGFDMPVRYETISYDGWTRALTEHVIIEYHNYRRPSEKELDAFNLEVCRNPQKYNDLNKDISFYHPDINFGLYKAFHEYKQKHNKQYNSEEYEMRRKIFEKNWRDVMSHNQKNFTYKMKINRFSDRKPEELRHLTATLSNPLGKGSVEFPHSEEELERMAQDLPESFNLRLEGVISGVKNQGDCGSCWTFSTTAAVEGALARVNGGRNIDLSEQSLVDCAWGFFNFGCDGGLLDSAFKYILKYGIPTEREYGSYLAQDGKCAVKTMREVYRIKGFARVPPLSVTAMKVALVHYGPVAVSIYATDSLTKYSSGIFYDAEYEGAMRINHGVTVVGYGVRDGTLYWIVKNSWGEDWGQDGYVLMSATNNNCLVLSEAYYPIV